MWGDNVYDATGAAESMGKTHLDGGEAKSVNTTRASSAGSPVRVFHAALGVRGPLSAAVVEHALLATLGPIRDCYRADPARSGTEEGRVDVQFDVNETGGVLATDAHNAYGLADETLVCIRGQFATVTFPPASSKTTVIYPLLLIPEARREASSSERLTLAPEVRQTNSATTPCGGRVRSQTTGTGCGR
jgi:hypothetical protein